MSKSTILKLLTVLILSITIASCAGNGSEEPLTASGTIAATALDISPELGGRIVEIYVSAGDAVAAGDPLFKLDDEIMQAQYEQAAAGVSTAEAAYKTALEQLAAAELQVQLAEQGARYDELQAANQNQAAPTPDDFLLPAWYFPAAEERTAVETELADAQEWLAEEEKKLADILDDINDDQLRTIGTDIAAAEQAYLTAQQNLFLFSQPGGDETLKELAQDQFDAAKAELDTYQIDFDRILSDADFEDLVEARARVLLAQTSVDTAQLKLDSLMMGEDSLLVASAEVNVNLAAAQVEQAEAGIEQANAALTLLEIQLEKATVYSPMDGIVLSESLEVGQLVGAGMTTMTIAKLDTVELTVYIPEDQYGVLNLGDEATVTVDSYPEATFTGIVEYIADAAEFTPRNVQTVESRKATVYAVRISLTNPDYQLKPGMPADVSFVE